MIPKVIHYCWFGGKPIPRHIRRYMQSWRDFCPDYRIVRWDESNYDVSRNLFAQSAYDAKAWSFVADAARNDIIFKYGGLYLDTDVELLKNPDFLLQNDVFFASSQNEHAVSQGLMFGAISGHAAVGALTKWYHGHTYDKQKQNSLINPIVASNVLHPLGWEYSDEKLSFMGGTIYPPRYFDPYPSGRGVDLLCEDTVSIHHYSALWTGRMQQYKRRIAVLVGEDRILKVKGILGR